jgi:hypothetical protein
LHNGITTPIAVQFQGNKNSLSICVFGGIVDMKQQIFSASSPSDLKSVEPGHGYETTMPLGMPPIELRHQRNEGLR